MNNKTFRPALALPMKPTEDIDTAIISAITPATSGPITPIPEAREIRPFFRGIMPLPPSTNEAYKIVRFPGRDGREIHRIGPTPELTKFKDDAFLLLARGSQSFTDFQVLEAVKNSRVKTPLGVRLYAYFLTEPSWRTGGPHPEPWTPC